MARPSSVHPDFLVALRVLDAAGMPYAEAVRQLIPVANRLGISRPSYSVVRRFLIDERRRKAQRAEQLDRVLTDLLAGRVPRDLWNVFWDTSDGDELAGLGRSWTGT